MEYVPFGITKINKIESNQSTNSNNLSLMKVVSLHSIQNVGDRSLDSLFKQNTKNIATSLSHDEHKSV